MLWILTLLAGPFGDTQRTDDSSAAPSMTNITTFISASVESGM